MIATLEVLMVIVGFVILMLIIIGLALKNQENDEGRENYKPRNEKRSERIPRHECVG